MWWDKLHLYWLLYPQWVHACIGQWFRTNKHGKFCVQGWTTKLTPQPLRIIRIFFYSDMKHRQMNGYWWRHWQRVIQLNIPPHVLYSICYHMLSNKLQLLAYPFPSLRKCHTSLHLLYMQVGYLALQQRLFYNQKKAVKYCLRIDDSLF